MKIKPNKLLITLKIYKNQQKSVLRILFKIYFKTYQNHSLPINETNILTEK